MTRNIFVGLACIGLALLMSSQASAGWGSWGSHWHGGSYGSYGSWDRHGSYGSYGSYGAVGYASGGSYGSYGSLGSRGSGLFHGGLISRIRAHHARKMARWGGSGGSWGGSYGGSYGSWGGAHYPSHGSVGSYASYCAPGYTESAPGTQVYEGEVITEQPTPAPLEEFQEGQPAADDLIGPGLDDSALHEATRGLLLVSLPKSAKLFVNGQPTTSTGDTRRFSSSGLQPGYRYPYTVKAVIERDGKTVDQTKEVKLRAGQSVRLEFDFDERVETILTVNVPADAELTLARSKTLSKGTQRTFTTRQLTEGQVWSGYTIVASLKRHGQTLTKEQTIDLRGGESRQITFDFELDHVASR